MLVDNPSEKAKVFSRPIRMFRKFFEGELRQWCSYLDSFRQWPFSLFCHQKNLFFCRFCYEFFNHLRSVPDIHVNFNQKIFETRKSKYFFVRSWFALRYISKRTLLERSLGQALEFNTKSYPVKSILVWWDKGECLRIKVALNSFYSQLWQTNILSVSKNCVYREWNFCN